MIKTFQRISYQRSGNTVEDEPIQPANIAGAGLTSFGGKTSMDTLRVVKSSISLWTERWFLSSNAIQHITKGQYNRPYKSRGIPSPSVFYKNTRSKSTYLNSPQNKEVSSIESRKNNLNTGTTTPENVVDKDAGGPKTPENIGTTTPENVVDKGTVSSDKWLEETAWIRSEAGIQETVVKSEKMDGKENNTRDDFKGYEDNNTMDGEDNNTNNDDTDTEEVNNIEIIKPEQENKTLDLLKGGNENNPVPEDTSLVSIALTRIKEITDIILNSAESDAVIMWELWWELAILLMFLFWLLVLLLGISSIIQNLFIKAQIDLLSKLKNTVNYIRLEKALANLNNIAIETKNLLDKSIKFIQDMIYIKDTFNSVRKIIKYFNKNRNKVDINRKYMLDFFSYTNTDLIVLTGRTFVPIDMTNITQRKKKHKLEPHWSPKIIGVELKIIGNKEEELPYNPNKLVPITTISLTHDKPEEFYNIWVPKGLSEEEQIDYEKNVWKEIDEKNLNTKVYAQYNENLVMSLTYFKRVTTKHLNIQMNSLFKVLNPYITKALPVLNYPACVTEYEKTLKFPTKEYITYGWMNVWLTAVFKAEDGYIVVPQSKDTLGEPDFIILLNGEVIGIAESKAKDNYSWTELYAQDINYADKNINTENVFIIANKGLYISFGVYIQDWHTINSFSRKGTFFDGYLGLQVHPDGTVKPVPQHNVFPLQHRLYKAHEDIEQDNSITTLLNYLVNLKNNVDPSNLDFGPDYTCDSDGKLWKKKKEGPVIPKPSTAVDSAIMPKGKGREI